MFVKNQTLKKVSNDGDGNWGGRDSIVLFL